MKNVAVRRSSRCEVLDQGGCVGVGRQDGRIIIEDVTPGVPEGTLSASPAAWRAVTDKIKTGVYDL